MKEKNKMQTNKITQWAALLLTFSGMAAAPLSVTAQQGLIVSNSAYPAESGMAYSSTSASYAALHVTGSLGHYSGTNITLSSTFSGGNGGSGLAAHSSVVELYSSTITTSGSNSNALDSAGTLRFNNLTIITSGVVGRGAAPWGGSFTGTGLWITTTGDGAVGVQVNSTQVNGTSSGFAQVDTFGIITSGSGANGIVANSGETAHFSNGTVQTTGESANGVYVMWSSTVKFTNVDILVSGNGANGILTAGGASSHEVLIDGGSVRAENGDAIRLAGTETVLDMRNNVTISGNINSTSSANMTVNSDNSTISGNVNQNSDGNLTVNLNNSNLTGNGNNNADGTLTINGTNSVIIGGITGSGSSTTTVNLNNSAWTGASSLLDDAVLTVAVDNNSTWNMTADSQVNNLLINSGGKVIFKKDEGYKTLTVGNLNGSGEFHMNTDIAANTGDLLDVTGTSAGSHQVCITNHGNDTAGTEPVLLMVRTADGQASFSGTVSVGMFDYSLYKDGSDWYLTVSGTNLPPNPPDPTDPNPPTPPTPQPGDVGKDILTNTPGSQAPGWFDHNDNIGNHLTDLRDSARERRPLGGESSGKDAALTAGSILNSVWIKAYGAQLNISSRVAGTGVREFDYGTDIGADHQWNLDNNNTLIAGAFAGYGRTDRETRNNFGGESNTDSFRLGLYGIWLNNSGWFADVIAKGQYADSHFNAYDASYNHTTADYDNWGGGISADFGKRFDFEHGWYIEPSVSAAYAHLTGSDYTTGGDNIFNVSTTDVDVFQFKIGVAFGRTIKLSNSGVLQPYIKVAGVEQISTGGKLRASGAEWRPNFDGARAEIGGGIIWQLNADHQLSLDYEASFGDKYDKPWGLTAGYRYQF